MGLRTPKEAIKQPPGKTRRAPFVLPSTTDRANWIEEHSHEQQRDACHRPLRPGLRARPGPGGRRLRRRPGCAQRPRRPQARRHRPLPDDRRRRRGAGPRAPGGTRGLDPRRRPQRRRPCGHRRRSDDRPRRAEGDRSRSRTGHRHRRWRRDLGGAERRRRRARARRDRRRDLFDRHRRLHTRRWPRLADGQVRARLATTCWQSSSSPRTARCSTSTASSHPDLFWALRGGGGNFGVATSFTYQLHPRRDDRRRSDRPPDRRRARAAALLPRRGGRTPRTT